MYGVNNQIRICFPEFAMKKKFKKYSGGTRFCLKYSQNTISDLEWLYIVSNL